VLQAKRNPKCSFTAVSNSRTQKAYIDMQAQQRGLSNVTVITADMNDFKAPQEYDRVVSIEMFEHMKNYQARLGASEHLALDQSVLLFEILDN
jgi:cyclopropane-fatty-acyl-phospholipid synthase